MKKIVFTFSIVALTFMANTVYAQLNKHEKSIANHGFTISIVEGNNTLSTGDLRQDIDKSHIPSPVAPKPVAPEAKPVAPVTAPVAPQAVTLPQTAPVSTPDVKPNLPEAPAKEMKMDAPQIQDEMSPSSSVVPKPLKYRYPPSHPSFLNIMQQEDSVAI